MLYEVSHVNPVETVIVRKNGNDWFHTGRFKIIYPRDTLLFLSGYKEEQYKLVGYKLGVFLAGEETVLVALDYVENMDEVDTDPLPF